MSEELQFCRRMLEHYRGTTVEWAWQAKLNSLTKGEHKMAQALLVTDKDGKAHIIMTHTIKSIDAVPAVPAELAVEAQDAVPDDPGEHPSATNPTGRPPVKGHPKVEAKAAKPGKPAGAVIHSDGGDVEVALPVDHLLGLINN